MIVYRCTSKEWAEDLSGTGAFLYGGRWNSPGVHMLYTAENNVLAAFEVALRIPVEYISKNYVMVPLEIEPEPEYDEPALPKNWNLKPEVTQLIGNEFVRAKKHLLLKVPSALISDSYNFLINPQHEKIHQVRVHKPRPILFDDRLIEMLRKPKS